MVCPTSPRLTFIFVLSLLLSVVFSSQAGRACAQAAAAPVQPVASPAAPAAQATAMPAPAVAAPGPMADETPVVATIAATGTSSPNVSYGVALRLGVLGVGARVDAEPFTKRNAPLPSYANRARAHAPQGRVRFHRLGRLPEHVASRRKLARPREQPGDRHRLRSVQGPRLRRHRRLVRVALVPQRLVRAALRRGPRRRNRHGPDAAHERRLSGLHRGERRQRWCRRRQKLSIRNCIPACCPARSAAHASLKADWSPQFRTRGPASDPRVGVWDRRGVQKLRGAGGASPASAAEAASRRASITKS